MSDSTAAPAPAGPGMRLPLIFILLTVVIDAMGIGLILPVMPDLIREVNGGTLAQAAIWGGVLSTIFAVMQFLFSPAVGNLSDRYGRRPVLIVSLAVLAVDYVVMAVAGSIWLLLLGRIVGGITAATQSTAYAYVSDISAPTEKAARFGLVGAAFGVGFVLGPVIGGLLAEYGTRAPFYAAALLAAANGIFGWVILPETVTDRIRRPLTAARMNPFGAFRHVGALPAVRPLLVIFFVYQVAFTVYPAIWAYFTQERFGWSPAMVGYSLAAFGISIAAVQGGLIRVILRRLGERRTVLYGIGFNFCAFLAMALVTNGVLAMVLTPLTALGAVVNPALQGMMGRATPDDSQGELQGVLTSAGSLAMIISLLVMTQTFSYFTRADTPLYLPGAPFLVSMGLMALSATIYLLSPQHRTL